MTNKFMSDSSSSLIYRVPDSIFKSGSFDTWVCYKNLDDTSPYSCSYITYKFAGTDNRLTYIVFFDIPGKYDYSSQEFSLQMTVRTNVSVLYNIYDGSLGLFGDDNRIKVTSMKLGLKSVILNGVFNERYYAGVKTGSNIGNIVRATLAWVPYASQTVSSYDYLTSSSDTVTGKWFIYPSTAQAQREAYNGKIINEITAEDTGFKNADDYLLLMTKGNGVNNLYWSYEYWPLFS